jgi:succinate-acetate transporter protein
MVLTTFSIPRILLAWMSAGVIRVLLGSSTSPIAYFFFGLFWLISIILLIAAITQLVMPEKKEQRIEAIAICAGLVSLFAQGLIGGGNTIAAAAFVSLVSAFIILFIYGRKLWRGRPIHP